MKNKVILASSSPRRKELLSQIGIEYEVIPSLCEEVIIHTKPEEAVQDLALKKAEEVAARVKDTEKIVLGADTVVVYKNQILGKPANREEAYKMIHMLAGEEHYVYTGVCLSRYQTSGKVVSHSFYEKTAVFVSLMSQEEIEDYLEGRRLMETKTSSYPEWADKAGAYGIQGSFAAFISKIEGDYNNVVGLPIARVYRELKEFKKNF